jgi:hypothetical protein
MLRTAVRRRSLISNPEHLLQFKRFPCASKLLDWLAKSVEHLWTSIELSKRPFHPFPHIAFSGGSSADALGAQMVE